MPRPAGYVPTFEERERIAASQRERWKQRMLWVSTCKAMLDAIHDGRRRDAHAILTSFMNEGEQNV